MGIALFKSPNNEGTARESISAKKTLNTKRGLPSFHPDGMNVPGPRYTNDPSQSQYESYEHPDITQEVVDQWDIDMPELDAHFFPDKASIRGFTRVEPDARIS